MDFNAIENQADFVANDSCFGGLPLVARFRNEFVGRFEIVDGAIAIDGVRATSVIAKDLNFVASAKVEAAVGIVRDHVVEFDGEVPKFLVRDQVVSMKVFVRRVFQDAVFDGPTVAAVEMAKVPAGGVFAVEERTEAIFIGGETAHR